MSDLKNLKNPLNQAFGLVLRNEREKRSWSCEYVAQQTGLKSSYIQQVEKGQYNLHVSKCFTLYKTFKGVDVQDGNEFSLEGLMQLLGIISVLEARGKETEASEQNYMKGIKQAAHELRADIKIDKLFSKFFEYGVFDVDRSDKAQSIIIEKNIHSLVNDFLVNYNDFESNYEKRESTSLESFFDDLPSLYFEYVKNSKENLLKLPFQIAFSGIWEWEARHKNDFVEMICLCDSADGVISEDNLSRYSYRYLWENNFEKVQFIFFNEKRTSEEIKSNFSENLRKSLTKKEDESIFNTFEDGINKFNVKVIKSEPNSVFNSITDELLYPPSDVTIKPYSAIWIFTLKDGRSVYSVSFLANINYENNLLTEGISLNIKETLKRKRKLTDLWVSLK